MNKALRPLRNGRFLWTGSCKVDSIQFSFPVNKDGKIPKKMLPHVLLAIANLENAELPPARNESDAEVDN